MNPEISEYCVYTIVHREKLESKADQKATFDQRRPWITGVELWRKASKADKAMPVLLADATDCTRLLFWGLLTDVQVEGEGTRFSIDRLRRLNSEHTPQELVLRRTGKKIASNYIRPYAICRTPEFLEP